MIVKEVKKYMAFSKKNKIPLQEAVKRFILSKKLEANDYRVVLGLAEMVYNREAA